jgi:hypothetical protein
MCCCFNPVDVRQHCRLPTPSDRIWVISLPSSPELGQSAVAVTIAAGVQSQGESAAPAQNIAAFVSSVLIFQAVVQLFFSRCIDEGYGPTWRKVLNTFFLHSGAQQEDGSILVIDINPGDDGADSSSVMSLELTEAGEQSHAEEARSGTRRK